MVRLTNGKPSTYGGLPVHSGPYKRNIFPDEASARELNKNEKVREVKKG
jgi:hypothetical protein